MWSLERMNCGLWLAFDAQTSGGLVLSVPEGRVDEAVERLAARGESAWLIGRVLPPREEARLVLA